MKKALLVLILLNWAMSSYAAESAAFVQLWYPANETTYPGDPLWTELIDGITPDMYFAECETEDGDSTAWYEVFVTSAFSIPAYAEIKSIYVEIGVYDEDGKTDFSQIQVGDTTGWSGEYLSDYSDPWPTSGLKVIGFGCGDPEDVHHWDMMGLENLYGNGSAQSMKVRVRCSSTSSDDRCRPRIDYVKLKLVYAI